MKELLSKENIYLYNAIIPWATFTDNVVFGFFLIIFQLSSFILYVREKRHIFKK